MAVETSPSSPQDASPAKKAPKDVTKPPTTIHDLPVEILLYIFTLNTQLNFDHAHSPSRTTRHTSQVCKQWRNIALNCPALWAQSIDFQDPLAWIKKVTRRCGSLPIDMIIPSVTNSVMKSRENEHPENLHRTCPRPVDLVRRWDSPMCYDAKILAPWFFHIPDCRSVALKMPAVVWETFNLDKMDLSHLDSLTVVEAGLTLEPCLLTLWKEEAFTSATQWNLRSLTLSGCITAFDTHAFCRLSELTVHNVPSSLSLFPSQWLHILTSLPALKHLELINATLTPSYYNLDEPEVFYSKVIVSLPQLERLHLDGPLRHCSHIFDHLKFPRSCNITIATCGLSSIEAPFHRLVAAIERHFERGSSKKSSRSRSLLAAVTPSSCVINLTGRNSSQGTQNPSTKGSLSLSIQWFNSNTLPASRIPIDPLDVFSALISAIRKPCANVTNLNLVTAITIDNKKKHHEVLDTFLSSLNRLESIEHISYSTLQFLLPFFDLRADPDRTETLGDLLPCLRAISFSDVNFANYKLGELSLLGILLAFVRSRLPPTTGAEGEDKSKSGSDAGGVQKTSITDMRFRFCRSIREKAVKNFESFGVMVLRDGMSYGYLTVDKEKEKKA